jgi:hypothetical protein
MNHRITIANLNKKKIYLIGEDFQGKDPDGKTIGLTNYYMTKDNDPFFGISGEFHFSRMDEMRWEDEIIKMKMCGINMIATYIFWIHHEEIEGEFDFTGCRNLRKFIQLCAKHNMYVIIRIGPFDHGEVRNGGLPDWLYGKPFEVRDTNEGFMYYARRLYHHIADEIKGFLYQDGGPIIAAQIDNEYMHSSSPWEQTTGISNEWVNGGTEGETYILRLKEEAEKCGISTPFYTCTAWGGAIAPDSTLPLWGGYAYRPWLFYDKKGAHPATEEYLYQDFHNNDRKESDDFKPTYLPEERPYACCEMGGGMMCSYNYRFILPYKSVDAMANIKIASGCNFLGYYMFQGGTNPKGKKGVFLNESQVCKKSYDFQAALGEFGQVRESYQRLKTIHYFCRAFSQDLCGLKTVLPENASEIVPKDLDTLRYALRTDGTKGFLFINNFQDHEVTCPKENESIEIIGTKHTIKFEEIGLEMDENCILPFGLDLGGITLEWATVQPVTVLSTDKKRTYVFLRPEGMKKPQFCFEEKAITSQGNQFYSCDPQKQVESFNVVIRSKAIEILCVDRKLSDQMFDLEGKALIFAEGALLVDELGIRLETQKAENILRTYPADLLEGSQAKRLEDTSFLGSYLVVTEPKVLSASVKQIGSTRFTVSIPKDYMEGLKDVILKVNYEGDIGQAFINGEMIHDNFYNGTSWELGLKSFEACLKENPITIYITPLKEGVNVNVDSPMAARMEHADAYLGKLNKTELQPVYEIRIK